MRPLLRRPRFEEKNKKENKIQHHFLDCAAKKKPNASDVPALPPAALRRNWRKSKWQPHPTFFSGWWLSHDWICWVLRCLLSQVILLEKIKETLGPQTKTNKECMHSGCRMIEYVEWWDACYLKSYCWKRSEKLWDHKQKQIQSACSQPPWKKVGFL